MKLLVTAILSLLLTGAPQEKTELRLPIDTWYRVVQGRRPIGYVHEVLKRSAPPWRYEYLLESEFELTLQGKGHAEDRIVSAFLDDTLTPVELSSESHSDELRSTLSLSTLHEERTIEVRESSSADPVSWVLSAGDEIFVLPSLAIYLLRQNETLSRPGRITLRVLDPRGQEKTGSEVLLEAGPSVRRSYLGKEAAVLPLVFLRPFPASRRETEWKEAWIDGFGRIVEATTAGGARMIVAADRTEALEGLGLLHRHGRGDPFDKGAALRYAALERARAERGSLEPAAPQVTLDSLDSDLVLAQKLIEETRALKAAGDLEEASQSYLRAVVRLRAIRELALLRRPALLPQIEQTRDDAEAAWDGAARVAREARRLFVWLEALMDRLDLGGLERTQKELQGLRDRVEVERRPEREEIAAWAAEFGKAVARCRTRLDLARARLDVTGITIAERTTEIRIDFGLRLFGQVVGMPETVTIVRPVAMADVNGRLLTQGDLIEGSQIRVDRISPQGVSFSLRDEVREVGLRR